MSDTRENGNLDTRIRELVARAVADAPRAPELDPSVLPGSEPKPDNSHRGWWLGGGAAILAAAALITALLLVGDADDKVTTPATPPTVAPTPAPTAPPTTVPTTGTVRAVSTPPGAFVTAGPDGVVEHRDDGQTRTLTTEPMAMALDAGDGRVIVQRQIGPTTPDEEGRTVPLVLAADGSLSELFVDIAEWGGGVRLHDVEVVDGRRLLLYSVFPADPPGPELVSVIDLETGAREQVGETDGGSRLHLARTGLIVGTWQTQLTEGIQILAIPRSPAARVGLPSAADLGFRESYFNCLECPSAFTVSRDGDEIAWVANGELFGRTISPSIAPEQPIAPTPAGEIDDVDFQAGAVLFSFGVDDQPRPAVLITLDDSRTLALEGTRATFGFPPTPEETPPPTVVSPPMAVPAPRDAGVVLTAGPEGVVEHRGNETRTLTTEPMAIALDTGDGRVIVSRDTGLGAKRPLVLGDDGSLAPLFDYALWPDDVRLHDIEVVDGRRLLLYSVLTAMDDPERADESLFVIDLDTQERTVIARGTGGWEFGTDRLHLATTGLIVGEAHSEASHRIAIYAVPGSPADQAGLPTAADLGLENSYGDCSDCPRSFTVAPDGRTIAWVYSASGLVAVALGPPIGEQEALVPISRAGIRDFDLGDTAALLSFFSDPPLPPMLQELDGSNAMDLEGTTATFGPTG